jgi:hypothetical protein
LSVKSELQIRAEQAAARFGNARKPIVLEFAGVPKAGKTSTLAALQAFLKRCGFKVQVVSGSSLTPRTLFAMAIFTGTMGSFTGISTTTHLPCG